jgi:hypothetical protein
VLKGEIKALATIKKQLLKNISGQFIQIFLLSLQGCQMVYFQKKKTIWVNFGWSCKPFGKFYRNIFGIFSPVLVCCTKKNLVTLLSYTQVMLIKSIVCTQQHCYDFHKNLMYTLVGVKPGSAVPEADAVSTAPPP